MYLTIIIYKSWLRKYLKILRTTPHGLTLWKRETISKKIYTFFLITNKASTNLLNEGRHRDVMLTKITFIFKKVIILPINPYKDLPSFHKDLDLASETKEA